MKTKYWIALLCVLTGLCLALSLWFFRPGQQASAVQIISQGKVLYTLPLAQDHTLVVETELGSNTVTIRDGKVAVTQADCPDKHCMARGYCSGGAQIVCLPNRLVIAFVGQQELDGVVG